MDYLTGTRSKKQKLEGYLGRTLIPGESAYKIAVKEGFVGTQQEWLASLKGQPGDSVDINVISSTPSEYIIEFKTSSKKIQSPNLKSNGSEEEDNNFILATNDDIENIFFN